MKETVKGRIRIMDGINIDIRPESEFIEPETSGIIQDIQTNSTVI